MPFQTLSDREVILSSRLEVERLKNSKLLELIELQEDRHKCEIDYLCEYILANMTDSDISSFTFDQKKNA